MPRGESPTPTELRKELASIDELHSQFQAASARAKETGDPTEARRLRLILDARMKELNERVNPFEGRIDVRKQHEFQEQMLTVTGILETWDSGEYAGHKGITGIDQKRYPLPTYEEVSGQMMENREVLETKIEQGFTKLLLVPFGMPIDTLIEKYKGSLQRHFDTNHLFYTRQNPDDPTEALVPIPALNDGGPLFVWDTYTKADTTINPATNPTEMVYHPESLIGATKEAVKHNGKTKIDLIKLTGGWNILLIENMPNIHQS